MNRTVQLLPWERGVFWPSGRAELFPSPLGALPVCSGAGSLFWGEPNPPALAERVRGAHLHPGLGCHGSWDVLLLLLLWLWCWGTSMCCDLLGGPGAPCATGSLCRRLQTGAGAFLARGSPQGGLLGHREVAGAELVPCSCPTCPPAPAGPALLPAPPQLSWVLFWGLTLLFSFKYVKH